MLPAESGLGPAGADRWGRVDTEPYLEKAMNARLLATLSAALIPTLLAAQDAREMDDVTGWYWYYGASATTIDTAVGNGYRPIDLRVESSSPLRFTAAMVRNTGAYQSGFWWYYGLTAAQLGSYLGSNQGRLIDLEAYDVGGSTRFACVMVPNTGSQAKSWWYYYGTTTASIATQLSNHNARLVDFDEYAIGGNTYYSAVMIQNTGADARGWYWYSNVSATTINNNTQQHGTRVYEVERRSNGNFNCILIDDVQNMPWTWWYGLDAEQVQWRYNQYGHRITSLQTYDSGGQRRFAIATLNNSNALTTQVGGLMRGATDGTVGCYLRQLNGGELAGLNESTVFEPASTMKTLHHVHAMRRVLLGAVSLNTPVNVFTGMSGSCPQDNTPISEPLTTVLRKMMENSDNARTQAVAALFGQANINATAAALGMSSTDLNHRLGCAGDAIANPNQITLVDLWRLHEQVANGYLGGFRDEFYEHMLNGLSWAGISGVIDQEAAALSLGAPAVAAFKAYVRLAQKGGSYTLIYQSQTHEHRAGFGYILIPFVQGGQVQDREYAVGAFVNDATNGGNASTAVNTAVAEMLRPTLRAALMTWDVTAIAQSFGSGCDRLHQGTSGLPRLGSSVGYPMTGGQPSSLAVHVIGFSDDFVGRVPLPLDLSVAGAPGCFALCDIVASFTTVANGSGQASRSLSIPATPNFLGLEYFTQWYSFGAALRSSNGVRNVIGG